LGKKGNEYHINNMRKDGHRIIFNEVPFFDQTLGLGQEGQFEYGFGTHEQEKLQPAFSIEK
jgi:hypothetical protein